MDEKEIKKFRKAVKEFWTEKMSYRIDSGELDKSINNFLNGDIFEFNWHIEFLPNDVIFMRSLLEIETPSIIIDKIHKKWDIE